MDWTDDAIVLAQRRHGETSTIVSLLTRERGRHAGLVQGGASSKARPLWQPGNLVRAQWRARLAEHLGHVRGELLSAHAAHALDDPLCLAGLMAACATIDGALPEREPHPALFLGLDALLSALGHPGWPEIHVRLELGLLQELGYGLDLSVCALTGETEDLAFVSPRTGRAVTRAAAAPYKEKLLALPAFLAPGGPAGRAGPDDLAAGLALAGHFLERHVYWPHNKPLPPARERFIELLQRIGTTSGG